MGFFRLTSEMPGKISTYWKCQVIGWSCYGLIIYVINNLIFQDFIGFLFKTIVIMVFGIFFTHLLRAGIKKLNLFNHKFSIQITYLFILTLLFSAIITFVWLIFLIKTGIYEYPDRPEAGTPFYKLYLFNTMLVFLTMAGWTLVYSLVHYMKKIQGEAEQKALLKYQAIESEAKALRAQMNPHFIFNALNAVKTFLLRNDTANADKYLGSFAKLQRLVLDNTRESKVILENEIKLLELYLRLEHLRFENRLTYHIHVDEKINPAETEIPSMLIQPFVENAIVHGLQHKTGKGEIRISFCQEDGWIKTVIEDDEIGRAQAASFQKNEVSSYKSLATKISQERLSVLGRNKIIPSGIEIIDLYDEQKKACGTRVIICIPLE